MLACAVAAASLAPQRAAALGAATAPYLLVGTGDADVAGTTVAVSNFELGANVAAVPMPGLTLVEPIPLDALPVPTGVTGDGDVAIVDPGGRFDVANLAIEGAFGFACAASAAACNDGVSDTTFDGLPFPANGLTGGVAFGAVLADLAAARSQIPALPRDALLSFPGGEWDLARIDLGPGLTVFDIDTGGDDLLLANRNVVIDGPPGAQAIFRVPDAANFLISQAAILVGDGGIAPGSVLFYSDRPDNAAHFNFSSALVNGVAFWSLGQSGGEASFDNVQGCTQVIGDKLNLSDVRLTRCAFAVPEPGAGALAAVALGAVALLAARARPHAR
ncbi:MAG: hypothetical protein DCC71_01625 [Proteobacteria bacterium]|nr:MAG: hypothetical protein DCC71_01625 [Pseudomonadota bacterium]